MSKNQCDGCAANMPRKDGIHYDRRYPFMYCQAYRYRDAVQDARDEKRQIKKERP